MAVGGRVGTVYVLKIIFVCLFSGAKWASNPVCFDSLNRTMIW